MADHERPTAQWAADPAGRHRYRFWDGTRWTELVTDSETPGPDPLPSAFPARSPAPLIARGPIQEPAFWTTPAPDLAPRDPATPRPVALETVRVQEQAPKATDRLPLRTHAALTVATLGLWLLAFPALLLWRRQSREWAVVWSIASVVLVVLGGVFVAGYGPGSGGRGSEVVVVPDLGIAAPATTSSTRRTGVSASTATSSTRPKARRTTTRTTRPTVRTPRPTGPTARPAGPTGPLTRTTRPPAAPTPTSTTAAATTLDPRFLTCIQAKAAGYGPYRRGVDPEYAWYWDFDGDGVVCP